MRTRRVGSTNIDVSEVTLGTWGLATTAYGPIEHDALGHTVGRALEAGVTTFDVAPLWGDGAAELLVARAVSPSRRASVQYVTRAGVRTRDGRVSASFDGPWIVSDCEDSLKRLASDHVDVLLLHGPKEADLRVEGTKITLDALKRAGKIRAWGVSTGRAEVARLALGAGADVLCLPYNLLHGDLVHDLAADVAAAGAGLFVRSSLAYGLLSGTWNTDRTFAESDHRRGRYPADVLRRRVGQVERLRFLVHGPVASMTSAAIRFALANRLTASVIVGARSPSQIEQIAAYADGPPYLPEEDMVRLSQVLAALGL
jgi:aryl-alcohol dehydrogenase-like predicted oxidoreductase